MVDAAVSASDRALWVRCCAGLTLTLLSIWLSNTYLYPEFVMVNPLAREVGSLTTVTCLVLIAFLALRNPRYLDMRLFTVVALLLYLFGQLLIGICLESSFRFMLLAAAMIRAAGSSWIMVTVGISLSRLGQRPCLICIGAAFVGAYLSRPLFGSLEYPWCLGALIVVMSFSVLMVYPIAAEVVDDARKDESPADLRITHPDSVLLFSHRFFVAIIVFRVAYGFALTFEAASGNPVQTMMPLIPLLIVFALTFSRRSLKADHLYQVAALFVVAGFLTVIVQGPGSSGWAVPLFYSGSEFFDILMYYMLSRIGHRNAANAITIFAWGRAASSAGLLLGTTLGHSITASIQTSPLVVSVTLSVMLFLFFAFNITLLKDFGFQSTIDGVMASAPVTIPGIPSDTLDLNSADVARANRLTPRETEILILLAHGRNGHYIQEYLTLSYNTVKTHVSNIYGKLGVHSQQELIDLVEKGNRRAKTQ